MTYSEAIETIKSQGLRVFSFTLEDGTTMEVLAKSWDELEIETEDGKTFTIYGGVEASGFTVRDFDAAQDQDLIEDFTTIHSILSGV